MKVGVFEIDLINVVEGLECSMCKESDNPCLHLVLSRECWCDMHVRICEACLVVGSE